MTSEEIEASALSDPANPPFAPEELAKVEGIGLIRAARRVTGLETAALAAAYDPDPDRLGAIEAGVVEPSAELLTLLARIVREPDLVRTVVAARAA